MQKSIWRKLSMPTLILAGTILSFSSCKKSDDDKVVIPSVTVTSVKSGATELGGSTAADKVSLTADLVVTFSKAVNATTANDFSLISSGGVTIPLTIINGGATVTLNPTTDLQKNTNYALTIKATVKATDGGPFVARTVSFKTDNPTVPEVTITSIKSGATDLAGATNISVSEDLVITFSKDVMAPTASNFTLSAPGGIPSPTLAVTTAGSVVTINPATNLYTGVVYTLTIDANVLAVDSGKFAGQTVSFTTTGPAYVVPPQSAHQIAYFEFNNSVTSSAGSWTVNNVSSGSGADRRGFANNAVSFNGSTDIIEVADGANLFPASNTWSFWIWTDTTSGHGLFAMGINGFKGSQIEIDGKAGWFKNAASFTNAAGDQMAEDLFFNGDGKYNANGGWQGHNFNTDLSASGGVKGAIAMKWAHIVYTYDAATKLRTVYLNGTKMMQSDFNLWPVGDAKLGVTGQKAFITPTPECSSVFAFGFAKDRSAGLWATEPWGDYNQPGANHFKGMLDDVRFFDVPLTSAEVSTLYNAEKP